MSRAEWKVVRNYLDALKREGDVDPADRMHNDKCYRLRFILVLAYSTGMRLSELAALRCKDIKSFIRSDDGATCWEAEVHGKRNKMRTVQITSALLSELETYLARRPHARFSVAPPATPIIAALRQ